MKILWYTWKDKTHPLAGGAELVTSEIGKRLVADGHEPVFLVGGYDGASKKEKIDGYTVIRVGGRWSVYWYAYKYYKKHLQGWADVVIDEMNTVPFFTKYYVKEKNIMFVHQLCREIWFYQMFFPLNIIGYILEFFYLRLLNDRDVITVSESTKKDLMRYGFDEEKIYIISEGITLTPLSSEDLSREKYTNPTILSFGSVRAMKRTGDIVRAFEILKENNELKDAKLIIAGDTNDPYAKKVIKQIHKSPYADDITVRGRVTETEKLTLMQKSHVIAVTSIKEGWGLVITEANSQGTPAVVYNVDGLRDSVRDGDTGTITHSNTPEALAESIAHTLARPDRYEILHKNAWSWSKEITFMSSYEDFTKIITTKC